MTSHFTESADYWDRVYSGNSVKAQVYRRRQSTVLQWIHEVAGPGSSALEVGTGAGHLAVAIARRGSAVVAIDRSEAMLDHVRRNAAEAGVHHLVTPLASDAQRLPFEAETFDIVVAVGLLPWVERPDLALTEMARVTKPGGHVVVTMDNSRGAARFVDPGWHPRIRSVIRGFRSAFGCQHDDQPVQWPIDQTAAEADRLLRTANLVALRWAGVGFGPFTFLGRNLLPNSVGLKLDRRLQRLSERKLSLLQNVALFHVVLAQKPVSGRA